MEMWVLAFHLNQLVVVLEELYSMEMIGEIQKYKMMIIVLEELYSMEICLS
mgnify:FL=1